MTRVYALTLVCDVYEQPGCHNAFVRARAGAVPDVREDGQAEAEAEALGWRVAGLDDGRLRDVCPVCAAAAAGLDWPPWPASQLGADGEAGTSGCRPGPSPATARSAGASGPAWTRDGPSPAAGSPAAGPPTP